MIEIRHKETGQLLLRVESDSLREMSLPPGRDLGGADLRGLDLSGSDLSDCDMNDADLCHANLIGARLTDATLTDADLSGARFDHRTEWPEQFEPQEHGAIKIEWAGGSHRLDRRHGELHGQASRHWIDSMARLRAGQAAAGIVDLKCALRTSPSSLGETALAVTIEGLIRLLKRHTVKALVNFREAIDLYPPLAVPHVAQGYALVLRGRFEQALAAYQRALQIAPYDRDLYLPLLRAFEQAGQFDALAAVYGDLLFPNIERPISTATVPNPVELFLNQQPDRLQKALCGLVLAELVDGRPLTILPHYLRESWPWPHYATDRSVRWLGGQAPLPELSAVWEFLSGSEYQVECRIMNYWGRMEEQGFGREPIHRRMEIAQSFQKLCEELGCIRADDDLPFLEDWE